MGHRIKLHIYVFVCITLWLFLKKYFDHIRLEAHDLAERDLAVDLGVLELEHLVASCFLVLLCCIR